MPPPEKLKHKLLMPEKTQTANAISKETDGCTGVTLYALSTTLRMAGA